MIHVGNENCKHLFLRDHPPPPKEESTWDKQEVEWEVNIIKYIAFSHLGDTQRLK
jgi:hypothetical protein